MRELLQGIALGVLLATGILAFVYYKNPTEVVMGEKEYTIEDAVSYLESQDYEVMKKDTAKSNVVSEEEEKSKQTEEIEDVEEETETETETEKETETANDNKVKEYQLVIERGMSSIAVAKRLYENGMIDDATAFNEYLGKYGYQQVIRIGTYQVNEQMSYEQIAKIITN